MTVELEVGQELVVKETLTGYPVGGGGVTSFTAGSTVRVTRIFKESVWLKGVGVSYGSKVDRTVPFYPHSEGSYDRYFGLTDPNAPKPRKLGEVPEGDHIAIGDPRIQWIFDDMATYADNSGYCSTYDTLADELGIPGRPRDFTISETINGFVIKKKYKARSRVEAQALFDDEKKTLLT